MAAVEVTISGVLYDKVNRTMQNVVLIGEASLTGLGVGGGPIIPPGGGTSPGVPTHPIALPGDPWWGQDLHPAHPIVLPPTNVPQPDPPPSPGDPTTAVPGNWPVQPVVPPPFVIINYPGIGPIVVPPPAPAAAPPTTPPESGASRRSS